MDDDNPEFIPTRSSLLRRLRNWEDAASWELFSQTYRNLIYQTATKAGLTDAEAQDVAQDTLLSVAKAMREFAYDPARGSFKGWLLQLTGWRIKNQLKKRSPHERLSGEPLGDGTSRTDPVEQVADPCTLDLAAFWDRNWQQNLMDAAVAKIKHTVNPRHYEVFYLLVIKKLPAREVAAALSMNSAQVYLAKHRVARLVKREVARLRRELF